MNTQFISQLRETCELYASVCVRSKSLSSSKCNGIFSSRHRVKMQWPGIPIHTHPSLYLCLHLRAGLAFVPWRWRWEVHPKYWYLSTKLHVPISQKTVISPEKCSLCRSEAAGKGKRSQSWSCCVGVRNIRRTAAVRVMQLHLPSVSPCRCWHFRASSMMWVPEFWNTLIYSAFSRRHTTCKPRDISNPKFREAAICRLSNYILSKDEEKFNYFSHKSCIKM